jgi:hypothetical protein
LFVVWKQWFYGQDTKMGTKFIPLMSSVHLKVTPQLPRVSSERTKFIL